VARAPSDRLLNSTTFKVIELFQSFQGEGQRVGTPTIFLRLAGCNLQCPFCDTAYARDGSRKVEVVNIRDIVAELFGMGLSKHSPYDLCITGGEPLLQKKGVELLVKTLQSTGFPLLRVNIQTNGTIPVEPSSILSMTYIAVSPKPPKYELNVSMWSELKIVIPIDAYENVVVDLIKKMCYPYVKELMAGMRAVFLQPVSVKVSDNWMVSDIAYRKAVRISRLLTFPVRVLPQVHRLVGWQ